MEGAQIANAEHNARHGKCSRRKIIQPFASKDSSPDYDIGNRCANYNIQRSGDTGIENRVKDEGL